jgi:hypothetical protein
VNVSIVRRVDVQYEVLTRSSPLELDVTGPTWLRVYTRVWWPGAETAAVTYRLSLWQEDDERTIEQTAGRSGSSIGPGGRKVGEWRSFFVQVPAGASHYRLVLNQAPADTVGVRIVEQAPRPWQPAAIGAGRLLTLVEGRDTARFRELTRDRPLKVEFAGPCRVRVRARLNFVPSMSGTHGFVLTAEERTQLARKSMRVSRSPAGVYTDEPAVLPSTERTLLFNLPAGKHEVLLRLSGTLARSAAVRVEVLAGEKYE